MTSNLGPRDSSGRRLTDYPRPSVAVDTAVLTALPGEEPDQLRLGVLLVRRASTTASSRASWALPGTFLHDGETLDDAVRRSLAQKTGVTGRAPQQLHVFDDPGRDDRGWVLSVAHLDVIAIDELDELRDRTSTRVAPLPLRFRLPYDHASIIEMAVSHLREEYQSEPDPQHLLPEAFTVADLRTIHVAVAGAPLQKDTFRRQMMPKLLEQPRSAQGRVGRPASLFTRAVNG